MKKVFLFLFVAVLGLTPGLALAVQITNSGDPALSGAALIDFEAQGIGSYASLTFGPVTFVPNGIMYIETDYSGSYNSSGQYLANRLNGFNSLTFQFSSPVNAFGFNFGASNEDWVLSAFDGSDNLLDSFVLPQTWTSNAGDFFGIAAGGIAYATLTQTTHVLDNIDYILLDNFKYAGSQVPIPGAVWLLGTGLLGLLGLRRKLLG